MNDHADHFGALEAGAAYALLRHGQDAQTRELINAIPQTPIPPSTVDVHVHLDDEDDRTIQPVNALDFSTADMPDSWDDYIGQGPLKRQLMIYMKSAQVRGAALPHILLASGMPGVGKTTMARLIAKTMDVSIIELVPPFNIYTLVAACESMLDHDIVFIDEIHLLALKRGGPAILLKVLEDKVAYLPDGTVVEFNDITIIGATTDKDLLPETILQRFKRRPYFQPYSWGELGEICIDFAYRLDARSWVDVDLAIDIAEACQGTPRVIEEMVLAARDLGLSSGQPPTATELLTFLEVEPDGLTRTHVHYLTAMRKYFARRNKDEGIEYIVGEAAMTQILRETKQGIGRVERFLIERGLIDRTPRGRRLTPRGIARAEQFIREGKGPSDIA
jgi:Holliday junction DNA helicase RuvB